MTRRSVVQLAKDAKHAQHVFRHRLPELPAAVRDRTFRAMDRVRPYTYRDDSFPDSFLSRTPKVDRSIGAPLPRRVFTVWSGDNEMSVNRSESLREMRRTLTDVELVLVTPHNMSEWLIPVAPLHSSFPNLSLVHRSDYLRAYLLHHYGGAYLDIKRGYGDVVGAMTRLTEATDKWVLGYRELGADYVSDEPGSVLKALRRHHGIVLGTPSMVARPGTPFTEEWVAEMDRRLDGWETQLEAHPGDAFGTNESYPVPWAGINGAVFQPLCLKYADRVLTDDRVRPSFEDYR